MNLLQSSDRGVHFQSLRQSYTPFLADEIPFQTTIPHYQHKSIGMNHNTTITLSQQSHTHLLQSIYRGVHFQSLRQSYTPFTCDEIFAQTRK